MFEFIKNDKKTIKVIKFDANKEKTKQKRFLIRGWLVLDKSEETQVISNATISNIRLLIMQHFIIRL